MWTGRVPEVGNATFVAQDDYVYYPKYECYYSVSRHQYAYREGNAWVSRPAPRGVSVNVLRTSPSVKMNFHDSPAQHHAAVVKQYPKNWKPAGCEANVKAGRMTNTTITRKIITANHNRTLKGILC